jgi:hypothetical protein
MLQGTIIVGLSSNGTVSGSYYNTAGIPSYDLGSSGPNFFLRESVDLTADANYAFATADIIIQQIA